MEDQSKTLAVSVRAKEFVSYHCSCCGHCCRHIENCVMEDTSCGALLPVEVIYEVPGPVEAAA